MAVDKFPIEAGHIMLFARSIGDANPIYYDAEHAKETEGWCSDCSADIRSSQAPNSIPITFCDRKSARSGLGLLRAQQASPRRRVPVVVAVAVASTLSSITSTTSPSKRETF